MRILTLNTGLLRLHTGLFAIDLVPRVLDRLGALPSALGQSGADVICLQEVFEREHAESIIKALASHYPHALMHAHEFLTENTGLVVLAKDACHIVSEHHSSARGVERVAPRGALLVRFTDGPLAGVALANVHLPYGGYGPASQTSAATIALRDREVRAIDAKLQDISHERLLVGDCNFGPNTATDNFDTLLELGYDVCSNHAVTWETDNPLNRLFPFSASQSIDHVATAAPLSARVRHHRHERLFTEPLVMPAGSPTYLSDHYGVLCEFHIQ